MKPREITITLLRAEVERLQKLVDNKVDYANDMRIALNKQRSETAKWKRAYENLDAHIKGCLV
jgi:hypothetical protein